MSSEINLPSVDKKNRERQFLDEFQKLYPDFPQGRIETCESPDFPIHQDTRTIGIELVDYVRGQNNGESINRRNEVLWQRIADSARAEYEKKNDAPLMVHFFWYHNYSLCEQDIPRLVPVMVDLVQTNTPTQLFGEIQIDFTLIEGTLLDTICNSIIVTRVRNVEQRWTYL